MKESTKIEALRQHQEQESIKPQHAAAQVDSQPSNQLSLSQVRWSQY